MNNVCDGIVDSMVRGNIIHEEDAEIYRFGLECFTLMAIHYISYLLIAALLGRLWEVFVIALVFLPLRKTSGGYHAKTRLGCYIFSCIYVLATLVCYTWITNGWIYLIAGGCSIAAICLLAPIDNPNKPMEETEKQCYHQRSLIILLVVMICIGVLWVIGYKEICMLMILGVVQAAVLIMIATVQGWIHNGNES